MRLAFRLAPALVLALALALAAGLSPQALADHHGGGGPHGEGMGPHDPARMQAMHAEREAEMKKLDDLVAAMNAAEGEGRVDAMAAVLSELVAQHRAHHQRRQAMHEKMMQMRETKGGGMAGEE